MHLAPRLPRISAAPGSLLEGPSNYPTFKISGPNPFRVWLVGPETMNVRYLDPQGLLKDEPHPGLLDGLHPALVLMPPHSKRGSA